MKNCLKENWFKLGIIVTILIAAVAIAYYFVIYLPKEDSQNTAFSQAQKEVSRSESSSSIVIVTTPTTATSNTTLCNGVLYSVCPVGQSFVCPTNGDAYCQLPQQKTNAPVQSQSTNNDLAAVVTLWAPNIAFIDCQFQYANSNQVYLEQSGSGYLLPQSNDSITSLYVSTNRHVVTDTNGYGPASCSVSIPNGPTYIVPNNKIRVWTQDYAELEIASPDATTKDRAGIMLTTKLRNCQTDALIGASIVILGYPGIGGIGITATEGIISSYDGNYYVTSAKVEHGNSGGAAIEYDSHESCYLGLPTFAETGTIESLARILKWTAAYKQ